MNVSHRILTIAIALVLAGGLAPAAGQTIEERLDASPRHQDWVGLEYGEGKEARAFIVHPESADPTGSVLVIHDIRGMSGYVRLVCDKLAEAGYFAIAPDFLSNEGPGGGGTDSFEGSGAVMKAVRELEDAKITAVLDAAAGYATGLPSTTDAVSVGGFCWGGSQTFRYATTNPDLNAAFVFYGSPPEKEAMERIQCPVYGFYAENDNRINATLEDTKAHMKEVGKTFEPEMYPGMGHGFVGRGLAADADEAYKTQTQRAWERWVELLGK